MVSLIVPCYNGEAFIDRCIDSILSQTYKDIELIFVNDGSTDNTDRLINNRRAEIEQTFTRFIYIKQENQGVGAACSNGFGQATGEYLSLLDVDDILLPDSVKLRVDYLNTHPEYALVRTNGYYVQEDNVDACDRLMEVNEYMKVKEDVFEDIFNSTTYLWPGTYMIRMTVLDQLYPDRKIYPSRSGQNLQFVMMAAYKNRAGFIDVPLMKYVVRKESLSHFSSGDVLQRELKALEGYEDIRRYLINQYLDEKETWNDRTTLLYVKVRMQLALKYQNKELMRENYAFMRHSGARLDINTKILYYSLINPPVAFCFRVVRKAERILPRIKRGG